MYITLSLIENLYLVEDKQEEEEEEEEEGG